MSSHEQVVRKFAERVVNRRTGDVSWAGSNVFCTDKVLYSYGRHFPLAVYVGQKDGKSVFIKNGDKYSQSTSCHQGITESFCQGPTVLRSEFLRNNLQLEAVSEVIFWRAEFFYDVQGYRPSKWFVGMEFLADEFVPPSPFGKFKPSRRQPYQGFVLGDWSSPAAAVLKYKRSYLYYQSNFGLVRLGTCRPESLEVLHKET